MRMVKHFFQNSEILLFFGIKSEIYQCESLVSNVVPPSENWSEMGKGLKHAENSVKLCSVILTNIYCLFFENFSRAKIDNLI